MTGQDVEMDQHGHAGRQLSALLSAALAAAQAAAQVSADRARKQTQVSTAQSRDAERQIDRLARDERLQVQQDQQRAAAAQREMERQARAEEAVRHRQWAMKPTSQWLHDNPLSAAAAWASADVHRGDDPVAARHAEQWESVFAKEGIAAADVRANAPAAVARAERQAAGVPAVDVPVEAGEVAAAAVTTSTVAAGTNDFISAMQHDPELLAQMENHMNEFHQQGRVWTAYADGAPPAQLGGRGVSTPPSQVLAAARQAPDSAATSTAAASRAAELVPPSGLER